MNPIIHLARKDNITPRQLDVLRAEGYIRNGELTDLGMTSLAHMGYCIHGFSNQDTCHECGRVPKMKEYSEPVGEVMNTVRVAPGFKTLRDEFAMAALTGLLAGGNVPNLASKHAYAIADTMMEIRDNVKQERDN